jgi:hypothetical protein
MRYIFRNVVVIILLGIIGYQYYTYNFYPKVFNSNNNGINDITGYSVSNVTRDTIYENIYIEVESYKPQYIVKVDTVTVVLPMDIDSAKIFFDYFLKYTYIDTLNIPGLGLGYLTDIITQNRITERSVIWDYSIPKINQTVYLKPTPRNNLWVGGNVRTIGGDFINSLGGSVLLQTKKDKLYRVGAGVGTNPMAKVRTYMEFEYYWKLNR